MPVKEQKPATVSTERKVIHPKVRVAIHYEGYEGGLTCAEVKKILGWRVVEKNGDFEDQEGNQIVCDNNIDNRPLKIPGCDKYAQDNLTKHWKDNCENVIIGKTGKVISGQHRLIGFVFACQIWAGPQKEHWLAKWPEEPKFFTLVAYGCPEDHETVGTIDNCFPRSFADVLYTNRDIYGKSKPKDRVALCKMLDYSVRLLWSRTGAGLDAFSPKRTHSEAVEFLDNHKRLLKAVKLVYDEDAEGGLSNKRIPLGTAAGLLYLMGCSATSEKKAEKYYAGKDESKLDFAHWAKACQFWVDLAKDEGACKQVTLAIANLYGPKQDREVVPAEKICVLINAWKLYVEDKDFTAEDLAPRYQKNAHKINVMIDSPSLDGIDLAEEKKKAKKKEEETPSGETNGHATKEDEKAAVDAARRRKAEEIAEKIKAKRAKEAAAAKDADTGDEEDDNDNE